MQSKAMKWVNFLSSFGYIVGSICLFLLAIGIIISAIYDIVVDLSSRTLTIYALLDEVGLLVFSIAVIDVCKFLLTEEVLKKGSKPPREARHALTKFAVIIATALSLEGLVLTIEVAKNDVRLIGFPVALLLTAMLFIVGIGMYQKLNASAEHDVQEVKG